jgi:ABC-type tungstate transport system permease subunit
MLRPIPRLLISTAWAGVSSRLNTLVKQEVKSEELQLLANAFLAVGNDSISAITDTNPNDKEQMQSVVDKHKATIVSLGLNYGADVIDEKVKDETVKAILLEALQVLNTELPKYL